MMRILSACDLPWTMLWNREWKQVWGSKKCAGDQHYWWRVHVGERSPGWLGTWLVKKHCHVLVGNQSCSLQRRQAPLSQMSWAQPTDSSLHRFWRPQIPFVQGRLPDKNQSGGGGGCIQGWVSRRSWRFKSVKKCGQNLWEVCKLTPEGVETLGLVQIQCFQEANVTQPVVCR